MNPVAFVMPLAGAAATEMVTPAVPVAPGTAEKFAEMVKNAAPAEAEPGLADAVGDAVLKQDAAMRANFEDARTLAEQAKLGDRPMDTAQQIEMMYRVSAASFQFSTTTALAQSLKNGTQTLMRNQ